MSVCQKAIVSLFNKVWLVDWLITGRHSWAINIVIEWQWRGVSECCYCCSLQLAPEFKGNKWLQWLTSYFLWGQNELSVSALSDMGNIQIATDHCSLKHSLLTWLICTKIKKERKADNKPNACSNQYQLYWIYLIVFLTTTKTTVAILHFCLL